MYATADPLQCWSTDVKIGQSVSMWVGSHKLGRNYVLCYTCVCVCVFVCV